MLNEDESWNHTATFKQLTCNRFPPVLEVLDDSNISSPSKRSSGCWLSLKSYGVKDTAWSAECWWEKAKGNRPKLRRKRFDADWDNALRWFFVLLPEKIYKVYTYFLFFLIQL